MRGIVVAGELGSFLGAAEQMGVAQLGAFVAHYQKMVKRYLHSRPLFSKFIGDEFVYVYETATPMFSRNVLHSTMVLEAAFQDAVRCPTAGLEELTSDALKLSSLNIGVAEGRVFCIDATRGMEQDVVGLPMQVARTLAGHASEVQSHILVDHDMALDTVCRQWLELETVPATSLDSGARTALIVTPESLLREYHSDRERYQVVNTVEAFKDEIDRIARADEFSFQLTHGPHPRVELVFNPQQHRGGFDATIASSILLAHVSPISLKLYPEIIVPSDRVYTIQLPISVIEDYQIMVGMAIQSPESTLIGDELMKVEQSEAIVARLEALRALLQSSLRVGDRLALAYYRF